MYLQILLVTLFYCGEVLSEQSAPNVQEITQRGHEARFGLPITYGNDIQGYSGGNYTPVKIELGGLFLGTIIGLGAVLLLPKLTQLFTTNHQLNHGYFRNLPDTQSIYENVIQAIKQFELKLNENNIDSLSCLERVACNYSKSTANKNSTLVNSKNTIMNFAIEGTRLKTAMDRGSIGEDCDLVYPNCNLNKNTLISSIKNVITDNKL